MSIIFKDGLRVDSISHNRKSLKERAAVFAGKDTNGCYKYDKEDNWPYACHRNYFDLQVIKGSALRFGFLHIVIKPVRINPNDDKMRRMKKQFLFTCLILGYAVCFSQKVVHHRILFDIDDSYNEVDTVLLKNNLFTVNAYRYNTREGGKDSFRLYFQKNYDKSGRLIQLIQGDNLAENKVDYLVSFRKVADLLFEATVKYPADSKMTPDDFYIDTVINQTPKKVCLYKQDENKYIHVRSVYTLDNNGNLYDIKRYDLDNRLVHVYFPFGNRKPQKEWSDVSVNNNDSIIFHYKLYDENELKTYFVYTKKGKITEVREENNTFSNSDRSFMKKIIVYDSEGRPIVRTTVDENNQLVSEERFYYSGKILVKYTEDDNLNDTILGEEKIFNGAGQLVLYKQYNKYSGSVTTWKYHYDDKGLLVKDEYSLDEIPQLTRKYSYN